MLDRLFYALIAAAFGAIIGIVGWWLYGLGFSIHVKGRGFGHSLSHWLLAFGGFFAAVGFIFKEEAGTAIGEVIAGIFNFEANRGRVGGIPWWQITLVLAIVALVVWSFTG